MYFECGIKKCNLHRSEVRCLFHSDDKGNLHYTAKMHCKNIGCSYDFEEIRKNIICKEE